MLLSGTLLLVLSMVFSTVSFAAPNLGAPAAPRQVAQTCSAASPAGCKGEAVDHQFINPGGQCKVCKADEGTGGPTVHCHVASCEEPECTTPGDCPSGNACQTRTCVSNVCGLEDIAGCCLDATGCPSGTVCQNPTCVGGVCGLENIAGCCLTDGDCDDTDACTQDTCVDNACQHASICECETAGECGDDNVCTTDACVANACVYTPVVGCCTSDAQCNDSDICTTDACVSNACGHTPAGPQSCYTGPAGTEGVGTCQPGTQSCSNNSWGACVGEVTPQTEICDGLDNDCDGVVDDGFDVGESCTVGIGECEATGTKVCTADHSGTECDATPGVPADEICIDEKDNDCDGSVDEGCSCNTGDTTSCGTTDVGECAYGTQTCVAGLWGICAGAIGPTAEICDGLDNDCDSSRDEGLGTTTCGVGKCQVSVDNCVDGKPQQCVPGTPGTEICGDNLDNDCDGSTDEGCREREREEPSPTPQVPPPAPEPTVVVEVLGVEELPETGIPPLAPLLPTLPMTLSALALIASGLMLRETDKKN